MDAATSNVADSLTFLIAKVTNSKDPGACYSADFIKAVAAAPGAQAREAQRKLKVFFGKEFNANQWNADVRDAKAALVSALPSDLIQGANGTIRANLANAVIQLRRSRLRIGYDSFSSKIVHLSPSPWGTEGSWRDLDDIHASNHLQHNGVSVSSGIAHEAAAMLASERPFHPVKDWLSGLQWDGNYRLNDWLIDYFGVPSNIYTKSVAAKWAISAVARIMQPGCKADHMMVLEGAQNMGKSLALRAITNGHLDGGGGVQWFRDDMPDIDKDDVGLYMQGVWIIEVAELQAIRGKEWTKVKRFLTSQADTFRQPYGRNMQEYPRQCIFSGSTNEDRWGTDPTGLRRFWPIRPSSININGILAAREQLWAEAVHRYHQGEEWHLDPTTEQYAKEEQADRSPDDPWVSAVADHLRERLVNDVSISEILKAIGERRGQPESNHVAKILNDMGWERYHPRTAKGREWRYRVRD